ncbi:L-histidine N(alpha)-methyltransferase [Novosphingobium profundi]|uniref:L-histidine N(alpha)-methyltransferase n=1 Tax=Novosphingobium profundi TaxID=1774954 RepID=UPI001BDB15C6|nr:L-histidine N(alpha)-methyltransferase [Novosphingobium profundi]MBT0667323.1 L-histidine N(alpha)-methyltransferase [Novosphingobium profundi]
MRTPDTLTLELCNTDRAPRLSATSDFRNAVLNGLNQTPKRIPCRYLYDSPGSDLFDQICTLPEYYPTRTEKEILRKNAAQIGAMIGKGARVIELGAGSGGKVDRLMDALPAPSSYLCIDISPEPLERTARAMRQRYPEIDVASLCADFLEAVALPEQPSDVDVCFFPGSTIGNFERPEATDFLRRCRSLLKPNSLMLIGVDLKKPVPLLEKAYDDAAGVTARFSLNVLARTNRELDANFDLAQFRHRARYVSEPGYVEITLVSQADQSVTVAGKVFDFDRNEPIHIENSHKYTCDEFISLARNAGYQSLGVWSDDCDLFSIHLLRAQP